MENTGNQVRVKRSVNYAFKIVGHLAHDNKLFDRTCHTCHKGMYSSQQHTRCPKCGGKLGYLVGTDGKAIAISEGTLYPAFGPKQEARDIITMSKRKNGMYIKYRFKMFSFIDNHGILIPPPDHDRCCKGSKVEILSMGHQLVPSWFMGKDLLNPNNGAKVPWVEFLIEVYTNYGDYVKVLTSQEYANRTVSHKVNHDGTPADIVSINDDIAALEQKIATIKAAQTTTVVKTSQSGGTTTVIESSRPKAQMPQETQNNPPADKVVMDPFVHAR